MSLEISRYFSEQLKDCNEAIYFDLGISSKLTERLEEVIKRNTIVDIAAKVEVYQKQLDVIERKLYNLEAIVKRQEKLINENLETNKNADVNMFRLSGLGLGLCLLFAAVRPDLQPPHFVFP